MIGGAKGIGIGIDFGIPNQYCRATSKPYIEKDVLDSLRVVASAYGKSNDDADRSIVKNLVDASNPFIISNAAFKLNSGFGKYEVDFTTWSKRNVLTSNNDNSFSFESKVSSSLLYYSTTIGVDTPSFKIKANISNCLVYYYYINDKGTLSSISILESGEFELPISHNTLYNGNIGIGFEIGRINGTGTGTITQIPSYQGAFVTDGIDDLITSSKTAQEMLGGSTEITVVSMINSIIPYRLQLSYTNAFPINRTNAAPLRNEVSNTGKTGIYGYTYKNNVVSVINNVLGDKNDYTAAITGEPQVDDRFEVTRTKFNSSVAWYWTIIANKVLTTDEINQVIAYFNLDKTLKPDILCNTIKQGITNENHAEFGDKLIDFSGNGRDIQLNNLAWDGDSGIGKYNYPNWKVTATIANTYSTIVNYPTVNGTYSINVNGVSELMQSIGLHLEIKYTTSTGIIYNDIKQDGVYSYILPDGATNLTLRFGGIPGIVNEPCNITITQIPSHAGALCLDGVNDFGKVTGLPIYKDYTVIADYERTDIGNIEGVGTSPVLSKSYTAGQGSFIMNFIASTGNSIRSYSFGAENTRNFSDLARQIFYQSKYKSQGFDITAGTGIDGDSLWLGTARDNDSRFFNGAIYSLMSFPYSMSEFLIERQLKKHKLGTLYPNMVEFRPVIKHDDRITAIKYYHIKGSSWINLKPGDYIPVGSKISITTNLKSPYTIANVVSSSLTDIKVVPSAGGGNACDILGYVTDKSPQKINLTIEQDEKYVLFNPIIKSNVEYHKLDFYLNNFEKRINIGDYIPKDAYLRANFYLKNNVDELTVFTFNGVNIDYRRSIVDDTAFNIGHIYNYDSPQEVNITIDEYIRYEDIKQPYPLLFEFTDENGNLISWGGKAKVGNTITRTKSVSNANILAGLYNTNNYKLNGKPLEGNSYVVEKQMVFTCTATWDFDNNEPKCILSPRLLRIPNSSYKILGHIPDISGHGNHGKINNSAYALASGANGYPYDYNNSSFWSDSGLAKVVSGELIEYFAVKNSTGFSNITSGVYKGEIKVTGVTKAISENKISRLRIYTNSTTDNELIDITQDGNYNIDIKGVGDANRVFFYAIPNNPNESIVVRLTEPIYIEQVGEYEGAYCLDGVDDFVTIPTLSRGGKQVLMKVNWNTINSIIYDQRGSGGFAIYCSDYNNPSDSITFPAYKGRNAAGTTYIDGIRNEYIIASQLRNVTHNIVEILDTSYAAGNINPIIGKSYMNHNYGSLALYDFMLFDNISTDDKIKQLNEYVGIEAKVELPPYYWDAYGKTNLDADKATIQQRGVAVGDYDLTNTNFAYDKMSGFGGYTLGKFTNSWSLSNNNNSISIVARNPYDITLKKLGENSDWEFNTTELKIISNPVSVKFKSDKNIRFTCDYHYYTVGGNSEGAPLGITSKDLIANEDTIITISPISQENIDKYNIDINRGYYLIYFQLSPTLAVNEEVTIEMLPLYPNGLVYDGITDYSENANIPALTDFTVIAKRVWMNKDNPMNECFIHKGVVSTPISESALMLEYEIGNDTYYRSSSYGGYINIKRSNRPEIITYQTTESYNGISIIKGSGIDTQGLVVGAVTNNYWKGVFYKLILYPKTIPLLQINFLKNLMERDEIIDLNNPIFIQE